MTEDLNQILNGPGEAAPEAEPTGDAGGAAEAVPMGEPETEAAPPAAEATEVPISALLNEREKRQAAERRLRAIESRDLPQGIPDRTPDREAFPATDGQAITNIIHEQRLAMSEEMARIAYPDFEQVMDAWDQAVNANPALPALAAADPHPANFAYNYARQHALLEEIGDPASFRERLRAEVEAELKGEAAAAVPEPSLAAERDAGGRGSPGFVEPSLEEIFA